MNDFNEHTGSHNTLDYDKLVKNNVSNNSFIINRVDIQINRNGEKQSLISTVRYNSEQERILIVLRTIAGIEVARFYTGKDTVIFADRFNQKVYYGKPDYFKEKFGIDVKQIFTLLGDYLVINDSELKDNDCVNGRKLIKISYKKELLSYIINCRLSKAEQIEINYANGANRILIDLGKFRTKGLYSFASEIKITGSEELGDLLIRMKAIDAYDNAIQIPVVRNDYEEIPLK
jgi:hypothetical protein